MYIGKALHIYIGMNTHIEYIYIYTNKKTLKYIIYIYIYVITC